MVDFVVRNAPKRLLEADFPFQLRDEQAQAGVRARAEAEDPIRTSFDVEDIGVLELPIVVVCRRIEEADAGALLQGLPV